MIDGSTSQISYKRYGSTLPDETESKKMKTETQDSSEIPTPVNGNHDNNSSNDFITYEVDIGEVNNNHNTDIDIT